MIQIRALQDEDWAAVCRIHDAARPDELRAGSCDPRAFVPIEEDPDVDELRRSTILVADEEGSVVGFVGVEDDYLGWLYVDPRHYRRGIGRMLLRASLRLIPGEAWTIVLAENRPAVRLYESEGFVGDERFESENAGYPCTCLRMVRPAR